MTGPGGPITQSVFGPPGPNKGGSNDPTTLELEQQFPYYKF